MSKSQHSTRLFPYDLSDITSLTYDNGDLIYDSTNLTLRVMDGYTPGGWSMATEYWVMNDLQTINNTLHLTNVLQSTDTTHGALVLNGGAGIAKNVNIGGNIDVVGSATLHSTLAVTNDFSINTNKFTVDHATGNTVTQGDLTVNGNTTIGNASTDTVAVNSQITTSLVPNADITYTLGTPSNRWQHLYVGSGSITIGSITLEDNNGSLTITSTATPTPAVDVTKLTNGTSNLVVNDSGSIIITSENNPTFTVAYNLTTSTTPLSITDSTTSSDTSHGALVVTGGVGIGDNLNVTNAAVVGGNLAVNGTDITTTSTGITHIFNTNTTEVHAFGNATTIHMGNATSSTILLRPGTLVGAATTQNVYNTVATTVNAFGAATTLALGTASTATTMGAGSGTHTINNPTFTLTNASTVNINGVNPTLATSSTGTLTLFNVNPTTVNAFGGATTISIGASTGTTTINNSVVVTGNLTVNGTTETINSTTLTVADKNIEIGKVATPTDTTANGGGILLYGNTNKTILWDSVNTNWTSSEYFNLASGKTYKINNVPVVTSSAVLNDSSQTSITIGGSATTVSLAASTGTTTIKNNLTVTGNTVSSGTLSMVNKEVTPITNDIRSTIMAYTMFMTGAGGSY
jgi:hypothetical protein